MNYILWVSNGSAVWKKETYKRHKEFMFLRSYLVCLLGSRCLHLPLDRSKLIFNQRLRLKVSNMSARTESAWEKRPTGANVDTLTGDTFRPSVKEALINPVERISKSRSVLLCLSIENKLPDCTCPSGRQEEPRGQDDGRTPRRCGRWRAIFE